MESTVCNNCGEVAAHSVLVGGDIQHGLPGEFTLVQCEGCGLLYLNPRLSGAALSAYYPEDYYAHLAVRKRNWLQQLDYEYGIEKRFREIRRYVPQPGCMLDVGCGTGDFLVGMRERGWKVRGIELSAQAVRHAREGWGLDVQATSLEEAELAPNSLDLVTLWNVLEHLPDPKGALRRIERALRPGGVVVFAVPNFQSYDRQLFGRYWIGYDLPRHLYLFPEPVLRSMLSEVGLIPLDRRCIYGTYSAFVGSLRFVLNVRVANRKIRGAILGVLSSPPARLFTWPAAQLVSSFNRGTIVTWFCRKAV
jgi:SAM-dependent methyltransferase